MEARDWIVPNFPTFESKVEEFRVASRYFEDNRERILISLSNSAARPPR